MTRADDSTQCKEPAAYNIRMPDINTIGLQNQKR
jgi:hypothetical protein